MEFAFSHFVLLSMLLLLINLTTNTNSMPKLLSLMTWSEVQAEMSIAGNSYKITQLGQQIEALLFSALDATNRAELTNAEFMLKRLIAEVKLMQRQYDKSHIL